MVRLSIAQCLKNAFAWLLTRYLVEENRFLRRQIAPQRLRFTDADRCRLAVCARRVGRAALREIATIATLDTLLQWHRQLVARKWTYTCHPARRGVMVESRRLVVRMADETDVGLQRIQGALRCRRGEVSSRTTPCS